MNTAILHRWTWPNSVIDPVQLVESLHCSLNIPWKVGVVTQRNTARPISLKSFASKTNREVVWSLVLITHDKMTPSSSLLPPGAFTNAGSEGNPFGSSHVTNSLVSTFSLISFPYTAWQATDPTPYTKLMKKQGKGHSLQGWYYTWFSKPWGDFMFGSVSSAFVLFNSFEWG